MLVPVLLAVPLVASVFAPSTPLADATITDAPEISATSVAFEPEPRSPGGVSDSFLSEAEEIAGLIERNPSKYTGVRVTSTGIVVTLPDGADLAARASAADDGATVPITFERTSLSRADVERTKAKLAAIVETGGYADALVGVGTDSVRGAAAAYMAEDKDTTASRRALKASFGDAVVFRPMGLGKPLELDRSRDTRPHFAGSGIRLWNSAHTGYGGVCSTSFPIDLDGTHYMLTAGHCSPGGSNYKNMWASAFTDATSPASAYQFGLGATTTMGGELGAVTQGTANLYGDFALIRGSTY